MADLADLAGDTIEVCLKDAEVRARGKSAPEFDSRFDGRHCVEEDCEVEIPTARLNMGKVRCVECQALLEKRNIMRLVNLRLS